MKKKRKKLLLFLLLGLGFGAMEFPGVIFFQNKTEPQIFGLPFIHGYMICCWIYMCLITFYAYKTNWGRGKKKT